MKGKSHIRSRRQWIQFMRTRRTPRIDLPDFNDPEVVKKFLRRQAAAQQEEFEQLEHELHGPEIITGSMKTPGVKSVHDWTPEEIRESFRGSEARVAAPLMVEIDQMRRASIEGCRSKLVGGHGSRG